MTHLTSDEFVDALDGGLEPSRQTHLDDCQPCRQQLTELAEVLGDAKSVAVPEPSPLYWEHLSQRVRTGIDAEPLPAGGWPDWLRWPVLVPIAALAMVLLTLTLAIPRQQPVVPAVANNEAATLDEPADEGWVVVAELVGDMDWDTAISAGLTVEPGDADQAVLTLTAAEQQELMRLLQAELTRAKS